MIGNSLKPGAAAPAPGAARSRPAFAALATFLAAAATATVCAGTARADNTVEREFALAPTGELAIVNVQGSVEVRAWSQSRVRLTARLEGDPDALRITATETSAEIRVETERSLFGRDNAEDAHLQIQVPAGVRLEISTVSADMTVRGHAGEQRLHSVSGDIDVESESTEVDLETVSGDLEFRGLGRSGRYRFAAVSGDAQVRGVGGDLRLNTVSGDARVESGALDEVDLESVSGNLALRGQLGERARVRAGSVSGEITLALCDRGNVAFDLESFSGDIVDRVTGRRPDDDGFGPGAKLDFTEGDGSRRVRVNTMSGDIDIRDCR